MNANGNGNGCSHDTGGMGNFNFLFSSACQNMTFMHEGNPYSCHFLQKKKLQAAMSPVSWAQQLQLGGQVYDG